MLDRIKLLPYWVIPNHRPAFYDSESVSALEQTGKVYGAMRELQKDYNKFATEVNTCVTEFINNVNADQEEFETKITKIIHDYIATIDLKIAHQDKVIADNITYITENTKQAVTEIIQEMRDNGDLDETILNVFNELDIRVTTLNQRIGILEKTENISTYDENTKSLKLEKVINE